MEVTELWSSNSWILIVWFEVLLVSMVLCVQSFLNLGIHRHKISVGVLYLLLNGEATRQD